jgi:hypothetical protein
MNVESVTIRTARESDADDLFPIVAQFPTSFLPDQQAFESSLPQILTAGDASLLVAERNGRVVGYLLGSSISRSSPTVSCRGLRNLP